MINIHEIKGYVETDNRVVPWDIQLMDNGNFSVYEDNDIHDGYSTFEEYIENCGNKIYNSLEDYKKDKFTDLRKWAKSIGWKENKNG